MCVRACRQTREYVVSVCVDIGKISKFMSWTSAASKADRNDVKSPAVPSPPPSSQFLEGTPKEARDDLFSSSRAPQVQAQLTFVADKNASPRLSKGSLVASLEAIQYQRKSLESAVSPQRDGFARSPHQEHQKEQALAQKDKDQTQAPTPQLKLESGEEEDIIAEVAADFAADFAAIETGEWRGRGHYCGGCC